jgi:hypothetical protein
MATRRTKRGFSIALLSVLVTVLSQSIYAASMLDRLMVVDDPELGECIRVAIKHIPIPVDMKYIARGSKEYHDLEKTYNATKVQTARTVTESYTQIKLLDSQIEQIDTRLNSKTNTDAPNTLRHELVLARVELESKRVQELAKLREAMGIIPRHAFGQIQLEQLLSWISLDVLDDQHVLVFRHSKPFTEYRRRRDCNLLGVKTSQAAITYISALIHSKNQLPLRIDIIRRKNSMSLSERISSQLREITDKPEFEIDTDVRLRSDVAFGKTSHLSIIGGKIGRMTGRTKRDGRTINSLGNTVDSDSLIENIEGDLCFKPGVLPFTQTLEYDEQSKNLVEQITQQIKDLAKTHGLEKLVTVTIEPTKRLWNMPVEDE